MNRNKQVLILFSVVCILLIILAAGDYNKHQYNPKLVFNHFQHDNNVTSPPPVNKGITADVHTPKGKVIFIARLQDGMIGFCNDIVDNVSLTKNKKYWKVKLHNGVNSWSVTVNNETWDSRKDESRWKSLDELKARYVGELYAGEAGTDVGDPFKIVRNGKEIWKVGVYDHPSLEGAFRFYVYFDPVTGKSKKDREEWKTLKELDETNNSFSEQFRNALRDLYPD